MDYPELWKTYSFNFTVICITNGISSMLKRIMVGKKSQDRAAPNYETVSIEDLKKTRRGRHHDFVSGVMSDLEMLKEGSAMKIPLKDLKGEPVVNLRAAVNRASASKGLKVSTSSDQNYFYIWRQTN